MMVEIGLNPQTTGLTTALNYVARRLGYTDTDAIYAGIAEAQSGDDGDEWWEE